MKFGLTFVWKSSWDIFCNHLHALPQNFFVEKVIIGLVVIEDVDQFNQDFTLFVFKFNCFRIFLWICLKICWVVAVHKFQLEKCRPFLWIRVYIRRIRIIHFCSSKSKLTWKALFYCYIDLCLYRRFKSMNFPIF